MSWWQTPAKDAADALHAEDYRFASSSEAERQVDAVLSAIAEPDAEMLDAGAAELHAAFPNQTVSKQFRIDLAGKIWRAMFDRVQQ